MISTHYLVRILLDSYKYLIYKYLDNLTEIGHHSK